MATFPIEYLTGVGLVKKSKGKLYVVSDPAAVGQFKVSGEDGITVDDDGYLKVSTTDIIQEGGGLAVDEDGKLYVDFSTMPTDKFEALLQSLRVPIWLEEDTTFYVNGTTGDDSNNGLTEATAFKTIQACINYVTSNYNLNAYNATISIAAGTYEEQLTCGQYSTTSGIIHLVGTSQENTFVVFNSDGTEEYAISVSENTYTISNLSFTLNIKGNPTITSIGFACLVLNNTTATVSDCTFNINSDVYFTNGYAEVRCLSCVNGGALYIHNIICNSTISQAAHNATVIAFYGNTKGELFLEGNDTASYTATLNGDYGCVIRLYNSSDLVNTIDGQTYKYYIYAGNNFSTEYSYNITSGSYINSYGMGTGWIPSGTAYIDSATYCWFA